MFSHAFSILNASQEKVVSSTIPYNRSLDGLRGISVLCIVLYHLAPHRLPGGFVGVDIFFVISGFLISQIILKQLSNGSFNFLTFYTRRIRRLFPALILTFTLCFIYGYFVLFSNEFVELSKHIIGGASFLSNWILYREIGYFNAAAAEKPLLHLWSLSIEEQFYLIWPVVLWGIFYCTRHQKRAHLYPRILFTFMFLFILFGWVLCRYIRSYNPDLAFYSTGTRIWELSLGALGACYTHFYATLTLSPVTQNRINFLALMMIAASFFTLDPSIRYFSILILLPVLSTLFMLISSHSTHLSFIHQQVLNHRIFRFFGRISYPMYLLHWPCISFAHIISASSFTKIPKLAVFSAITLASYGIYRYIEQPIRSKTSALSVSVLLATMGIIVTISNLGYFAYLKPYFIHHFPHFKACDNFYNDWTYPTQHMKMVKDHDDLQVIGQNTPSLLFLGDSNAMQYAPRVDALITSGQSKISAMFCAHSGACPFPNTGRSLKERDRINNVLQYAYDHPEIKTVVIAALWGFYCKNPEKWFYYTSQGAYPLNTKVALNRALKDFEKFVGKLISQGKKVYLVSSIPCGDNYDPAYLIQRTFLGQWSLNLKHAAKSEWDASNLSLKVLQGIAQRTGATLINPDAFFCNQKYCRTYDMNGPIYKDKTHLRASYVARYLTFLDFLFVD